MPFLFLVPDCQIIRHYFARAITMKKTAGRQKIVVDIPKIVELTNASLGARAIAKELGVSPSVVHRAQQAAQNEGVLGVNRRPRQPKTVGVYLSRICSNRFFNFDVFFRQQFLSYHLNKT